MVNSYDKIHQASLGLLWDRFFRAAWATIPNSKFDKNIHNKVVRTNFKLSNSWDINGVQEQQDQRKWTVSQKI